MQKINRLYWLTGVWAALSVAIVTIATPASAQCITWAAYSSKLPPQGGRGEPWKAFGKLPSQFQTGCVVVNDNNALDVAYVFPQGASINTYATKPMSPRQKVPAFKVDQEATLEGLVKQGKALKITWLTPTNGSLPYLRSIPRDRAFLRQDGMTCFNTVCMMSGAVSHAELAKILGQR